jgi:heat shock protein HtpX
MNTQTLFKNQFRNSLKTSILMATVFAIVGVLGYLISVQMGNINYLYIFLFIGIIQNVIAYWFSGSLAIRYSGAKKVDISTPDGSRLQRIVERLSQMADLPTPEVYIIPDENMNAFATGRNKYHAKVAATSGLMHKLDDRELEGVMAHELAHIGNKDILISSVVAVMAGMITHLIYIFASRSGEDRVNPIVGIFIMILAPFVGLMIQMAVSRSREFQADAGAAKITNNPQGLILALEKIHQNNILPMIKADESMAHMYIANPFSGIKKGGVSQYFMTHPPVEERVKRLRALYA